MIKLTLTLLLLTSCNIAGPKYNEQANAKKPADDKAVFTNGCKPLLKNWYYYWPVAESSDKMICNESFCVNLDPDDYKIIDGDIELVFETDMYLCKGRTDD